MIYYIEYLHISGKKKIETENICELGQLLDVIISNTDNSVETIKVSTEEGTNLIIVSKEFNIK